MKILSMVALIAGCALGMLNTAEAQMAYPSRPLRLVVGFPAGTSSDIIARIYAQKLTEQFKRQVVVDNRVGVASNIAADMVAKAPRDGLMPALCIRSSHAKMDSCAFVCLRCGNGRACSNGWEAQQSSLIPLSTI